MASETIREFLVSIGWETNDTQQRKFLGAIEGATLRAKILGDVIEDTARRVWDAVAGMADSFDKLYFTSQRTGASVETLKAIGFAASQTGSSIQDANAALETMGRMLRENRANIYTLNQVGFGKNAVTGQLEYQLALGQRFAKMSTEMQELWGHQAGLSETFIDALRHPEEFLAAVEKARAAMRASSLDGGQAAKDANAFMTQFRDTWNSFDTIAEAGLTRLLKGLTPILKDFDDFLNAHQAEISDAINGIVNAIVAFVKEWEERLKNVDWKSVGANLTDFAKIAKSLADSVGGMTTAFEVFFGLWATSKVVAAIETIGKLAGYLGVIGRVSDLMGGSIFGAVMAGSEAGNKEAMQDPQLQAQLAGSDARKQSNFERYGFLRGSWQNLKESFGFGGEPAMGAGAATGKWWTSERMQHAADRLVKEAGLSPMGAAGLVARWAGVEAVGGPASVNPSSGAFGIGQWLGSRKNGIDGNTDFDAQISHAIGELNGSESRAARQLRSAQTPGEAARGASMFERAEGYSALTGTDAFTSKTPVADVYGKINGGAAGVFVIGDSIGAGVKGALHAPGVTTVGRSPGGVLSDIGGLSADQLKGKTVILSGGASNDPSKAGLVAAQIKALGALGVDPKNIRVLGVGDRGDFGGVNDTLRSIAANSGATFVPIAAGGDHVHPGDYSALAAAALAVKGAPSPWGDFNPTGLTAKNFGEGGGGALGDYFRNHLAAGGVQMPDVTHISAPQTTTIHIDGANDPSIVAHMVAANQSRVAADMARNLQGATN